MCLELIGIFENEERDSSDTVYTAVCGRVLVAIANYRPHVTVWVPYRVTSSE